jgi:hypothetical protein
MFPGPALVALDVEDLFGKFSSLHGSKIQFGNRVASLADARDDPAAQACDAEIVMAVPGLDPGIVPAIHAVRRFYVRRQICATELFIPFGLLPRADDVSEPSLTRRGVDGRDGARP